MNTNKEKRNIVRLTGAIIGFVLLSRFLSHAGIENTPLNTDDANTLDKGAFSVSAGGVFTKSRGGDKETDINVDIGYGITEKLEITAGFPFVFSDPKTGGWEKGVGDISLRPELRILKEKKFPALSVASTVKFDSGNKKKGLGSGETDYSLSLQTTKEFEPLTFHFNLGHIFIGEAKGENLDNVIFYNFASEYALTEQFVLVGEIIGETNSDPMATDDPLEMLIGATYDTPSKVTFYSGLGGGLSDASPDIRILLGVTFELRGLHYENK